MKVKTLIVDDEYPARQELRYLLEHQEDLDVVGEAANAEEARQLIDALDYTVVFLDIDMPGMNGLELARTLQDRSPQPLVIFTTAYQEYALQAFEVNTVDYLLKPINEARLQQALQRVNRICHNRTATVSQPEVAANRAVVEPRESFRLGRIPAERNGRTILINEEDLYYATTEGSNVFLHTAGEKMISRFTLKDLEERLSSRKFFRAHRCYLINLAKVQEVMPFFNGTYTLVMSDSRASEIPVSRNQAKKLRELLGL